MSYRAGTHATFKRALLNALSKAQTSALAQLKTRDDTDFTVALLDGFAMMADVLTFYQERLANESYLATATELDAVADLTALVGYQLQPGIASSTHLAFTLDRAGLVGPSDTVELDPGFQVQSLPAAGMLPRTFETAASLAAIPELSALAPVTTAEQSIDATTRSFVVRGVATRLQKGDVLVIELAGKPHFLQVSAVTPDATHDRTTIAVLAPDDLEPARPAEGPAPPASSATTESAGPAASPAPAATPPLHSISQALVRSHARLLARSAKPDFGASLRALLPTAPAAPPAIFALRTTARFFGATAPDFKSMPPALQAQYGGDGQDRQSGDPPVSDWPMIYPSTGLTRTAERGFFGLTPSRREDVVGDAPGDPGTGSAPLFPRAAKAFPLDRQYAVNPGDYVAIAWPQTGNAAVDFTVGQVKNARNGSFNAFSFAGASTLLDCGDLANTYPQSIDDVRGAKIFLQSETLDLAELVTRPDIATAQTGTESIEINGAASIPPQRTIVVADAQGGEVALVGAANVRTHGDSYVTVLQLATPLGRSYNVAQLVVYGNVVQATHGESVRQILGNGDANLRGQTFTLRHAPLTFVRSATAQGGNVSTLAVRVGGLAWKHVDSLLAGGPRDHIFATSTARDGTIAVRFGDGIHGARLPTGTENVVAEYRFSTGGEDPIAPAKISLAVSRPLGFVAVTNPLPTTGGLPPDDIDSARRNAQASMRTLGRAVTLDDFRDLAQVLGGRILTGVDSVAGTGGRSIVVSIANADGTSPDATSLAAIEASLRGATSTNSAVDVAAAPLGLFQIAATVAIAADWAPADVLPAIRSALAKAFSPAVRTIGAAVYASEIVTAIHAVPGVAGVVLRALFRFDPAANPPAAPSFAEAIIAAPAGRNGAGRIVGREQLAIDTGCLATGIVEASA